MRNYTFRRVKGSSLFSLLIITLWVLPVCMSCDKNLTKQSKNQDTVPSSRGGDNEEMTAEGSWVCVVCEKENGQHLTVCQYCNVARQQGDPAQPQEGEKENQEQEEKEARELQEDEDPNKEECPVCQDRRLTQAQQEKCKYWICNHFVCEQCFQGMKKMSEAKNLPLCCPMCRAVLKDIHAGKQGNPVNE